MNTCFTKSYLLVLSALATMPALAAVTQLEEVVVTASRIAQPAREVIGDVTVIDRETIAAQGNATLPELLSRQPGIQVSSNGGAGKTAAVFIRGANPQQTIVLIDGIRYGSATAGAAALQHLPLALIDRIEILRGPAGSLYGADAIGGVIQVFTKRGGKDFAPIVSVGYGTENSLEASASVSGSVGNTSYALGVAHSQTDGISALAGPKFEKLSGDDDGYENTSVSLSASHKFDENHEIGGSLLHAWVENQYDNAFATKVYDYRDSGTNGSATIWSKNRFTSNWTSKLQAGISVDDSDNYSPATAYSPEVSQFKTKQSQLSWQNDIKVGPGVLSVGAETLEQKVSGTTKYDEDQRRINSFFGGYLAHLGAATLQVNLRNDDNSQFGNHTNGSIGAAYQVTDAVQVGASYGTGFRAPTFNELYYPGFGNKNLQAEESKNSEGFIRFQQNGLQAGATVFHNKVTDLLQYNSATYSTGNIGKATLQGVTLTLDLQAQSGLIGGASFDYLDASDDKTNKQLVRRAKQTGLAYVGWMQSAWSARAEVQGVGNRFDDAANKVPLAGYALVNLSAQYQLTKDWALRARVNNLFDAKYETAKNYGTLGTNGMLSVSWQPK